MRPRSGTLVMDISKEKAEHYEGVYQCTVRNEHGTAVSNNIVIRQSSKECSAVVIQFFQFVVFMHILDYSWKSVCFFVCFN